MDFMIHLEDLSLEELQKLVDDEGQINEFVMDDDSLKNLTLQRETLVAGNRSIADDNLGKEPMLLQMKSDLTSKYDSLRELHENYHMNRGKLASLSKEENLDAMLAVLQARLAVNEESTEVLAENLYNNEVNLSDFISQFRQIRKEAHLRLAKIEKLKEFVLKMKRDEVHKPPSNPNPFDNRHGSVPTMPNPQPGYDTSPQLGYGGFSHTGLHASSSFPQTHHHGYQSGQQYHQYQ